MCEKRPADSPHPPLVPRYFASQEPAISRDLSDCLPLLALGLNLIVESNDGQTNAIDSATIYSHVIGYRPSHWA